MSDSALQIFRAGVRKEPDNPSFRYHLGLALSQKGDKEKARLELETALKKKPPKDEEAKIREAIARLG
jgi:Flp pilus assembly protein TadD